MKQLKLAVIGTGMAWDRLHLPAIQELKDAYEVVALADPDQVALDEAAKKILLPEAHTYTDYEEMLKKEAIDVVNVAVPIDYNYLVSKDVLETGKHLICEKPLAPDIKQAIEFVRLQKEKSVKILIAENYRYDEEHQLLKQFIEEKRIGQVLYFVKYNVFDFNQDKIGNTFAAKEWRQHPKFEGGIFLDGGVHDLAGLRHVFGDLEAVSAFGQPLDEDHAPYGVLHCNLMFRSGITGQYTYACRVTDSQKPAIGLRIVGTKGTIYLEEKTTGIINIFYQDGTQETFHFTPGRGYYNEFKNFHEALTNENEVQVTPTVEFGDTKLIFALLTSAREQRVIKIDTLTQFITEFTKDSIDRS